MVGNEVAEPKKRNWENNAMRLLLVLILFGLMPAKVFSECLACSTSMGVQVELKSGEKFKGYVKWNDASYENIFALAVGTSPVNILFKQYVDGRNWKSEDRWKIKSDETFDRWAELISYSRTIDLDVSNHVRREWILYPRLMKIKFPFEKYLGIKGEDRKFQFSEMKSIKRSSILPLRVDTTGLDSLSVNEIELLNTEPKHKIELEFPISARVYLLYSDVVPAFEIVKGVFLNGFEKIMLDGVEIVRPRFGENEFTCAEALGQLQAKCEDLKKEWAEYASKFNLQVQPCYNERNLLINKHRAAGSQKPYDQPDVNEKGKECARIRTELEKNSGFEKLSSDRLRELGVISFSYAWD